jgi:hypothetical protein
VIIGDIPVVPNDNLETMSNKYSCLPRDDVAWWQQHVRTGEDHAAPDLFYVFLAASADARGEGETQIDHQRELLPPDSTEVNRSDRE